MWHVAPERSMRNLSLTPNDRTDLNSMFVRVFKCSGYSNFKWPILAFWLIPRKELGIASCRLALWSELWSCLGTSSSNDECKHPHISFYSCKNMFCIAVKWWGQTKRLVTSDVDTTKLSWLFCSQLVEKMFCSTRQREGREGLEG